jgi:hypothetical protein
MGGADPSVESGHLVIRMSKQRVGVEHDRVVKRRLREVADGIHDTGRG